MPHRARPAHQGRHPLHVTLRAAITSLRTQFVFPTICAVLSDVTRRDEASFRVVHFSVQSNHIHLLIEARDRQALLSGMRSLLIRLSKHINRLLRRRGRLWADRWHSHALTTPRATRHALNYVLNNFRKHQPDARSVVDPFSSGVYFDGFAEFPGRRPIDCLAHLPSWVAIAPPIAQSKLWLLRVGALRKVRSAPKRRTPVAAHRSTPRPSAAHTSRAQLFDLGKEERGGHRGRGARRS